MQTTIVKSINCVIPLTEVIELNVSLKQRIMKHIINGRYPKERSNIFLNVNINYSQQVGLVQLLKL